MELKFLGRGSSFNLDEDDTSAFFFDKDELFLIDCGNNIAHKIITLGLLDDIKRVNVLITHLHDDHVATLPRLILYCAYPTTGPKIPIRVIFPDGDKYNLQQSLTLQGSQEKYEYANTKDIDNQYSTFNTVHFIRTEHVPDIPCYSLIFTTNNGLVYYSGDTSSTNLLEGFIESNAKIDKIYIDISSSDFKNNPHLNIKKLINILPNHLKSKVYCMHFNDSDAINQAEENGLTAIKVYKKNSCN